jgi:hypothetical protein
MTTDADAATTNQRLANDAHYRVGPVKLLADLAGRNDPASRYERIRSLVCLGRGKLAAAELALLTREAPDHVKARCLQLLLEAEAGHRTSEDVVAEILRLSEDQPTHTGLWLQVYAASERRRDAWPGRRAEREKANEDVLGLAKKVLELCPNDRDAMKVLARAQITAGDIYPAMETARALLDADPGKCPTAWDVIEIAATRVGDRALASRARSEARQDRTRTWFATVSFFLARHGVALWLAAGVAALIAPVSGSPWWLVVALSLLVSSAVPYLNPRIRPRFRRWVLAITAVLGAAVICLWIFSTHS